MELGDLSAEIIAARLAPDTPEEDIDPGSLEDIHRLVEARRSADGNVTRAAKLLDVHRNTVHRWLRKYGLTAL